METVCFRANSKSISKLSHIFTTLHCYIYWQVFFSVLGSLCLAVSLCLSSVVLCARTHLYPSACMFCMCRAEMDAWVINQLISPAGMNYSAVLIDSNKTLQQPTWNIVLMISSVTPQKVEPQLQLFWTFFTPPPLCINSTAQSKPLMMS